MLSRWLAALEARHLSDLTFAEVARALRALSSNYVERRERLAQRSALDSAGKRAAYALYYSPLHWLTVARIVEALQLASGSAARPRHLLDLGCGAGAASAAWATALETPPSITAVDVHAWAIEEAMFTYRTFELDATTRRGDATRVRIPRTVDAIVAGWMINELDRAARDAMRRQLLDAARAGIQILIVEPIARRVTPWWDEWANAFAEVGGRADEWRFEVELPDLLARLDRAAGLRHDQLTARSIAVSAMERP
jgi:SAM-dependent methyltransferase